MNRRIFSKTLAGTALGAAALEAAYRGNAAAGESGGAPYDISVMMWAIFKDLSFEQKLDKIHEAGYKNAELVGEYRKWSDSEFQRVLAKKKEFGINFDTTAGLHHAVGNPNDREALLADVKNELPVMERLDCPAVIIMSGNVVPGMPRETQHQSCIEGLKRAASIVEGKQINGQPVRLLLENIDPEENPRYYLTSVAEGFEIIRAVNHPQVKLLYDFFHEQIAEGNLIEKLKKNIDYTGLVHIADVPGRHIPGTGEINYENIYKTLAELKYDRMVAMEFLPLGDGVEELRRAKEQALRAGRSA
ncbi:MAG: TIM barrel protein [Acidobacteriaceae bacterium]|nr:TIM barrel protein [Acidobacteriaceae bacterium]